MVKSNKLYGYELEAAKVGVMLAEPKLAIPTAPSTARSKLMSLASSAAMLPRGNVFEHSQPNPIIG